KAFSGKNLIQKQAIRASVNAYLSGDMREDVSFLTDEQIQQLDYFRSRIDVLSNDIIGELNKKLTDIQDRLAINPNSQPLLDAQERTTNLIQSTENNKGKYLTRDYEIFHNPEY